MGGDFIIAIVKLIILLPLVALLAYIFIRFGLTKMGGALPGRVSQMRVVDRLSLSTKSSLLVVQVAGRYYLIAASDGNTSLLKELSSYPEVNREENSTIGLAEILNKTRERFKKRNGGKGD